MIGLKTLAHLGAFLGYMALVAFCFIHEPVWHERLHRFGCAVLLLAAVAEHSA